MPNHSTEQISEHDLDALADLMADDPDIFEKLADAVATRLDIRLDNLENGQKNIRSTLKDHDLRFDVLGRNFKTLCEKIDGSEKRIGNRLTRIENNLGISTRRAG